MKKIFYILIVLLLFACGDDYNGNATIVYHEYDDPDNEWVPGYQMPETCSGGYGSVPRTCSPGIYIPGHMNHRPERFLLKVEWTDQDGKHHDSKREVPKSAYDECEDGRTINLKSMTCPLQ